MFQVPFVSVCIPAYKNTTYLKRLLDSLAEQTFTDYNVIVTDDSPDDDVKQFLNGYTKIKGIHYFKNNPPRGTPENWNEAIRRAGGKWIKIMHDDDWFTTPCALQSFHDASLKHPGCAFFFSAFQNVIQESGRVEVVRCNWLDRFFLSLTPLHLFKRVYIGNPSCTFIRRDIDLFYDKDFKYVVDFEYYIRCIRQLKVHNYIDEVLLGIGFNNEQVTKYTFLVSEVQIPENLLLLRKLGVRILRNPFVYDYYWRMFRNLNIRNVQSIRLYYFETIPLPIINMINVQRKISMQLLKVGFISKIMMSCAYILSLLRGSTTHS